MQTPLISEFCLTGRGNKTAITDKPYIQWSENHRPKTYWCHPGIYCSKKFPPELRLQAKVFGGVIIT
jgi:hypothetical protein